MITKQQGTRLEYVYIKGPKTTYLDALCPEENLLCYSSLTNLL